MIPIDLGSRIPLPATGLGGFAPPLQRQGLSRNPQRAHDDSSFSEDDAILYEVTPTYLSADSTIPVGVTMSAKIEREDGSVEPAFQNVYILNTQAGGAHNLGN
ncbi:hypothetical protein [Streptomyces wuyuanensis]|uniref:hypothetical protein n=1 Tax=Streptomyces wuyuanensis TaxID=1196353 RepID=UPI00371517C2